MVELLSKFRWRIKRVKVYALVGKTGTGKSFRARLITEKHKIDLVIDDGLLIRNHRILAGKSAKREKNRVSAIKRAVFQEQEHAEVVQQALEKEKFRSILIIGISDKMIERIVDRLRLPSPEETIYIEDIATEDDIIRAKEVRKSHGKHVIPVPMIEVRQDPAHRVLDSIKLFLERHPLQFWKKKVVEKTIVQPPFFRRGRLSISRAALSQMVVHCVQEYSESLSVDKIIIDAVTEGYRIEVKLSFPFNISIPDTLAGLQEYIIMNIERYSGIHIEKLDLTADQITKDVSPKTKTHRRKK